MIRDYVARIVVSLEEPGGGAKAFQLLFEELPAHPVENAGYHFMHSAAIYLLSTIRRDLVPDDDDWDDLIDEISAQAKKMAKAPEILGPLPDLPEND